MKKIVKIEGLDCPNCARALEKELNKIDGVENVEIDFLKSDLSFESKDVDNALCRIVKTTKAIEPDAKIIYDKQTKKNQKNGKLVLDICLLFVGIALGLCVLFIDMPVWLFWTLFVASALLMGYKTYIKAIKLLFKGTVNENLLITISVVGASAIGEYMEGLMVIALYSIGKILEGIAVDRSKKSIEKLTQMQPEYAVVLDGDVEKRVKPSEVLENSIIVVRPGEKVPIDGNIIEGSASLDMQSLTGESVPVFVDERKEILSGSIVLDGMLKIRTTRKYDESTVKKILDLIEHAQDKKSKTETVISKVARWYTLGVIVLAITVWGIVWAVTRNFDTALYRGLIFLVISCPCAFAISVPLSYFSGIGNASKHGILIKGSNYLDACAKINVVAFDKTGTLTTGNFVIQKVVSYDSSKSEEDILYLASLGEQYSLHPLAKAIVFANKRKLQKVSNLKEKAGEGVYFKFHKMDYFVGRKSQDLKSTIVEIFENNSKIGEIELDDDIKESSYVACQELKSLGVRTVMLSGDNELSAVRVAKEIGIDEVHHNLLPQEKFEWIEDAKKNKKNFVGYVGDGINDAPSLMLSDVGISMGINGSGASKEVSDIVLVDDDPSKVSSAIKISKYTRKIVWENIILSAVVKITFLLLGTFGVTGMLFAVFADVGVTVLAILNSMRALKYKPNKKVKKSKEKNKTC